MMNGNGICSWSEWTELSEDQRRYELHRILVTLDNRTTKLMQIAKWYAFFGGVIGGSLTVLSLIGIKLAIGGM